MSSPFRKKKVILPAALAAVIFLVALVPFILSSSFVLQFVLSSVNSRLPGNLAIDSWLVGWRQGILCSRSSIMIPQQRIRITVPRVTTTRGVLELAVAPANLGSLIIDSPGNRGCRPDSAGAGRSRPAPGHKRIFRRRRQAAGLSGTKSGSICT